MTSEEKLSNVIKNGIVLKRLLKLHHTPIGIALGKTAPRGLLKLDGEMSFCKMWKMAFEGKAFFATAENHNCITGQYYLGFKKWRGKVCRFLVDEVQAYCNCDIADKHLKNVPKISKAKTGIICVAPLEKANFFPNLILVRCRPEEAMLLFWTYSYATGETVKGETGTAICVSLVIRPYLDGKPAFSLGDPGGRYIVGLDENELVCSVPTRFFNGITETLRLHLKNWKAQSRGKGDVRLDSSSPSSARSPRAIMRYGRNLFYSAYTEASSG
ncbi:MAG: DUF169 domain-containing protein [Candidatus Bathyarchaeia archaeon]